MSFLMPALSIASLLVCVAAPLLYFRGSLAEAEYRNLLAGASLAWFVFATWWARRKAG